VVGEILIVGVLCPLFQLKVPSQLLAVKKTCSPAQIVVDDTEMLKLEVHVGVVTETTFEGSDTHPLSWQKAV
jgi:hypothetical protein